MQSVWGQFAEVTPGKIDIPIEEEKALEKAEEADSKRRSNISLEAIGIKPGAEFTLSRGENVHAVVVSGNKVNYEGQIMSLSAAALQALHGLGYRTSSVSGSDYWMYEGKTLDEIRLEKEVQNVRSASDDH